MGYEERSITVIGGAIVAMFLSIAVMVAGELWRASRHPRRRLSEREYRAVRRTVDRRLCPACHNGISGRRRGCPTCDGVGYVEVVAEAVPR